MDIDDMEMENVAANNENQEAVISGTIHRAFIG